MKRRNNARYFVNCIPCFAARYAKFELKFDFLQNRRGETITSPYSIRPKPGATFSTPLEWKEVKAWLDPSQFNIHTMQKRLQKKGDLFSGVLVKE